MARWGIAEDGAVLALSGPDALVDDVVQLLSPPRGLVWAVEPPRDPACSVELVPHEGGATPQRRSVMDGSAIDGDADGLIGSGGSPAQPARRSSAPWSGPAMPSWPEMSSTHAAANCGHGGAAYEVRVDGVVRPGGDAAAESVIGLFAAEHLRELVAVHAAVLVMGGGAVLVPGASHSGKSSLCAAACDAGVEVWSDEFALLHADGRVTGWPRPLRLRTSTGIVRRPLGAPAGPSERGVGDARGVGGERGVGDGRRAGDGRGCPDDRADGGGYVSRGDQRSADSAPVVLVAAVAYSAAGWRVRRATSAELMVDVLANTVPAARRPAASFTAAAAVSSGAAGVRGTRGEAAEAVERLRDVVEDVMETS